MQIAGGGGAHQYLSTQKQFKASLVHTVSSRTARATENLP